MPRSARTLLTVQSLLVFASACGDVGSPEYQELTEYPGRRFAATTWDTLSWFGAKNAQDTTLLDPERLTKWGDRLVMMEWGPRVVRVFDSSGTHLWNFGRFGNGPRELGLISDLVPTPWGNLWVYDSRNRKIVEVDPDGQFVKEMSTRHLPVSVGGVRFISEDRAFFSTYNPAEGIGIIRSDSLTVESIRPFPFADSVDTRINFRATSAGDARSGTVVSAMALGPSFMVMDGTTGEVSTFPYIDYIPWAVKQSPALINARTDSARYGALAAQLGADETVYFLFGGRPFRAAHPPEPTVLIDQYGLDGTYLESYLLPFEPAYRGFVLLDENRFALLTLDQGLYPRVYVLKPCRRADPCG